MPRDRRLNSKEVENKQHSGLTKYDERHYDGEGTGLALNVKPGGSKSWLQIVTPRGGKRLHIGLGPYPVVSLARAREIARKHKRLALEGKNPIAERQAAIGKPTFSAFADQVIDNRFGKRASSERSRAQWKSSLSHYVFPKIGQKRIDAVTLPDVEGCLKEIWQTKPETASRVRQRMVKILEVAVAHQLRADNPAVLVLQTLGDQRKVVVHHRALPWAEVPDAIRRIRATNAWLGTKLCFEFLVLTAARSGEVRGATWEEIDLPGATWIVPAHRMKSRAEHRVPLSAPALAVLAEARKLTDPPMLPELAGCNLIFPSIRGKQPSDSTISKLLRENGVQGTPHGFRSSFRDWASEATDARHAVMEACLAHTISSAVERAYARSTLFDKRRALMNQWGNFVTQKEDNHG